MMKKILSLLGVGLTLTLTTSCLNTEESVQTTRLNIDCYNIVTDTETNTSTLTTSGSYNMLLNITDMTVTFAMQVPSLTNQDDQVTISLPPVPLTLDKQIIANGFSGTDLIPKINGTENPEYTVTGLSGHYATAYNSEGQMSNAFSLAYNVGGKYRILAITRNALYLNCTTTSSATGQETFSQSSTYYNIDFNSRESVDVTINSAQFAKNMPQLNITLRDLPITVRSSGYSLQADKIIPYIGDVPYEDYTITDFFFETYANAEQMRLSFKCTISGTQYTVSATGNIFANQTAS